MWTKTVHFSFWFSSLHIRYTKSYTYTGRLKRFWDFAIFFYGYFFWISELLCIKRQYNIDIIRRPLLTGDQFTAEWFHHNNVIISLWSNHPDPYLLVSAVCCRAAMRSERNWLSLDCFVYCKRRSVDRFRGWYWNLNFHRLLRQTWSAWD